MREVSTNTTFVNSFISHSSYY